MPPPKLRRNVSTVLEDDDAVNFERLLESTKLKPGPVAREAISAMLLHWNENDEQITIPLRSIPEKRYQQLLKQEVRYQQLQEKYEDLEKILEKRKQITPERLTELDALEQKLIEESGISLNP